MDLLLRGSEIIKSQNKKYIFVIYSTFFESVGKRPLETCGRLCGERVWMVSLKGLGVFHRWRKEGKWRENDARCHQWLMNCLYAKGPAEVGEGPCRYLLLFFFFLTISVNFIVKTVEQFHFQKLNRNYDILKSKSNNSYALNSTLKFLLWSK